MVNWPRSVKRLKKLPFRALASRQSELSNCGLCVVYGSNGGVTLLYTISLIISGEQKSPVSSILLDSKLLWRKPNIGSHMRTQKCDFSIGDSARKLLLYLSVIIEKKILLML